MLTSVTSRLESLTQKFENVRAQSEFLAAPLKPEDTVVQPVIDVSPPKWHLGHTTWFFEEFLLNEYVDDYQRFHPRYNYLFNSYYEGAGDRVQRAYRGNMTRPTKDEILEYRKYVTAQVIEYLKDPESQIDDRALYILEVGLNHEQQHQELLVYDIKYILGHNPLFPAYRETAFPGPISGNVGPMNFLDVEEGIYEMGFQGEEFHFDNEEGEHKVFLHAFEIMDRLVTVGEFKEFVEAGGYSNYKYWLEEGWKWINTNQVDTPFYWFNIDREWHHFTHHGLEKLNLDAPMTHVNFYEADAFAKWKGMRLPTEFEWEAAARLYAPVMPEVANFVDTENYRPVPRQGSDHQFWGDVWEWTNSAYLPYPFYKAEDSTLGEYNGKFMINQMVLRGGSCATPRDHVRLSYRNFFHPHLQWLFNGFRLAKNA
ncbi:MAG: ergothioneine biosynthesis protein EgtB [Bacteroidia bacterium]|nr:ergothioneine biosynthesis protein EgtB [Bacteroidia bacterium]